MKQIIAKNMSNKLLNELIQSRYDYDPINDEIEEEMENLIKKTKEEIEKEEQEFHEKCFANIERLNKLENEPVVEELNIDIDIIEHLSREELERYKKENSIIYKMVISGEQKQYKKCRFCLELYDAKLNQCPRNHEESTK